MLPFLYRLPKQDITHVLRGGKRTHIDTIQFLHVSTSEKHTRLGILITKKFSKKAVERNFIKRQLHMACLPFLKHSTTPMDIMCKITQPIHQQTFEDLQNIVEKFFTTAT